jgi:hypothetical protein
MQARILCWWCRQDQHDERRFDSLTNSSPYTSVDLGARSLVSGVDCNDPEKSPILELFVLFLFLRHRDVVHDHAYLIFAYFVKSKIIWYKTLSNFCSYGFTMTLLFFSYLDYKIANQNIGKSLTIILWQNPVFTRLQIFSKPSRVSP